MPPTAGSALVRWTDEEHDILVQMANDQLELEQLDKTKSISWTSLWKKVSKRLEREGYNRSWTACSGYWKRNIQAQIATEEAAGPRWDDSEHQILLGMTEDQLELEKSNPDKIISWGEHWERVSDQLQERGYIRTAEACDAYWRLLQISTDYSYNPADGNNGDDQSEEANGGFEDEMFPFPQVAPGKTSTQQSSKVPRWTDQEHEILLGILKGHRRLEEEDDLDKLSGFDLWTKVSQILQQHGFNRTWEACKTYWEDQGRSRSGFDERLKSGNNTGPQSPNSESQRSSLSSWSLRIIEVDSPAIQSENTTPEDFRVSSLQKEKSHEALPQQVASPDPYLLATNAVSALANGYDSSKGAGDKDDTPEPTNQIRLPGAPPVVELSRNFRFTAEQRAFLNAEAANNGDSPDARRRVELAAELGVDLKTVRNWFVNYRSMKARRSEGGISMRDIETPASDILNDPSSNKRPLAPTMADRNNSTDSPSAAHSSKRMRVGDVVDHTEETTGAPGGNSFRPINQQPSHPSPFILYNTPEASQVNGLRAVLTKQTERQSSVVASTPGPSTTTPSMDRQGVFVGRAYQSEQSAGAVASDPRPTEQNGPSRSHSRSVSQSEERHTVTPQAATTYKTPYTPTPQPSVKSDVDEKTRAFEQVQTFRADIQRLSDENAARAAKISSIEQVVEQCTRQRDQIDIEREQEIARLLAEINEKYLRRHQKLGMEMEMHNRVKQSEVDEMNKTKQIIARKEKGMERWNALFEFYETEGDDAAV